MAVRQRRNKSEGELFADVDEFVERAGLEDKRELLYKAALVAQDRENFERLNRLSEEDKAALRHEKVRIPFSFPVGLRERKG